MRLGPPLFWLGVSLWVGGLAALALAAPTIFRTAPSRESAGLIFGAVLRGFSKVEIVCALLAVAGMVLTWNRPAASVDLLRAGLLALMVAILIVVQVWIFPSLEALRPEMSASETARERFQSLHRISENLYKVTLLSGLALIVVTAWFSRRPAS
jgi:purine-cytosine permease-like protein